VDIVLSVVIQSPEVADERMLNQLRMRKVDSGQYYGGQMTASAWATLANQHPMKNFTGLPLDGEDDVTVVDLGPGSGKPCVAAIAPFNHRVRTILCIDVSAGMAEQAAKYISQQTFQEVDCIIADFMCDAVQLRSALDADQRHKLFLLLGGTAGNFPQQFVLAAIHSLLGTSDRLLIGLGLYDPADPEKELSTSAQFFASQTNCQFGLSFLNACGHNADHRHAFTRLEDDPEEQQIKVVRGFYRFEADVTLRVGREAILFRKDEELQFVESRRYPRGWVAPYLQRHGLTVVDFREFDRHGLYLCRRGS